MKNEKKTPQMFEYFLGMHQLFKFKKNTDNIRELTGCRLRGSKSDRFVTSRESSPVKQQKGSSAH